MKALLPPLLVILPLAAAPLAGGCFAVAAAGGAASVLYVKGDLEADLDGDPMEVARAVEAGLEDLSLPVEERSVNKLDGKVLSRTAGGDRITITLKAEGDVTHVAVRIGTFGDETMSRRILDAIEDNL